MSDTRKNAFARFAGNKGNKKFLIFAGVVIAVAAGYAMIGGTKSLPQQSKVSTPPGGGGGAVLTQPQSPGYIDSIQKDNQNVTARAKAEAARGNLMNPNATAITTPFMPPHGVGLPTSVDPSAAGEQAPPPALPPPGQARLQGQPQQNAQQNMQQMVPPKPQSDQQLVAAMAKEMGAISKDTAVVPAKTEWFWAASGATGQAAMAVQPASAFGVAGASPQGAAGSAAAPVQAAAARAPRFRVPAAGTILYARLVGKVNSDVPGPVVGEVLQGPFSGSRILGSFAPSEEGVVMTFATMTVPYAEDGEQKSEVVPIKAVAVDSANLGSSMATDIDRHLFQKVVLSAATAFLQGFGQAIGTSGTTTVIDTNGASMTSNPAKSATQELWQAGGSAAGKTGQIVDQTWGNRKTTITVDADTPFGLLFLPASGN